MRNKDKRKFKYFSQWYFGQAKTKRWLTYNVELHGALHKILVTDELSYKGEWFGWVDLEIASRSIECLVPHSPVIEVASICVTNPIISLIRFVVVTLGPSATVLSSHNFHLGSNHYSLILHCSTSSHVDIEHCNTQYHRAPKPNEKLNI